MKTNLVNRVIKYTPINLTEASIEASKENNNEQPNKSEQPEQSKQSKQDKQTSN